MNRKQIQRSVGRIVAYTDPATNAVLPARILDARLWTLHYDPVNRVKLNDFGRASRGTHGSQIGYPALMPLSGIRRTRAQDAEIMEWLVNTTLTMGDLFDENGEDKGILEPGGSRTHNERLIFRVVFPTDVRENYPGVVRERAAENAAAKKEIAASAAADEVLRARSVQLSNLLAEVGFKSCDKLPIVSTGVGKSQRVSLPVQVLNDLMSVAYRQMKGCDNCGKRGFLLPLDQYDNSLVLLCATCHPYVSLP